MTAAIPSKLSRALSVAPMMDWTDRHCRYLHRLIAPGALLYTEMVVDQALLHGPRDRLLGFDPAEHPVALQLGGSEPELLARAARIGAEAGYAEINLNCGCPSDRVQSGRFGACLMREPERVADAVRAMRESVADRVPVTVKCRLGVDNDDSEAFFRQFVDTVAGAGCEVFIVHARKAWLSGLSPKENREVPPLDYDRVYRLKADRPELCVVLNGGLDASSATVAALARVDGVMLGRHACHHPWDLALLQAWIALADEVGATQAAATSIDIKDGRAAIIARYVEYIRERLGLGDPVRVLLRPLLGLFPGAAGARAWRRALSAADLAPIASAPEYLLELMPGCADVSESSRQEKNALQHKGHEGEQSHE